MSEAVKELIGQAVDQDFAKANKSFNDIITVKMSDLLDQEKIRLADQIYNGVEPDDDDEDDIMGDEDGLDETDTDGEADDELEQDGEAEEEEFESDGDEENESAEDDEE